LDEDFEDDIEKEEEEVEGEREDNELKKNKCRGIFRKLVPKAVFLRIWICRHMGG
jgi:hypothetical protein